MKKPLLGQLLVEAGLISEHQVAQALEEQKIRHEPIGKILMRHGWAHEDDILAALSRQFDMPVMRLSQLEFDMALAKRVPAKFAFQNKIVPVRPEGSVVVLATNTPADIHAFDDIRLLLECDIRPVLLSERELHEALKRMYGVGGDTMDRMAAPGESTRPVQTQSPADDDDAATITFVNQIITEACRSRATDIHIEPYDDDLYIRYRVDGMLHLVPTPPAIKQHQSAIVSRIKIMADMNIAERRLPQDGSIRFTLGNEEVDIRVSTLPVMYGESVDLRILPRQQSFLGLEDLGLAPSHRAAIGKIIRRPHGIFLVTGPTGNGKTTTLYACLGQINSMDKKIITVEDPVEYRVKGINQVPVHSKIGMTFANGLRSILRQDPDVIMVGEIRDQETAEIAIRASLTGHLVFSTLHTNDAPGAVNRLVDMGIEPYLVSSSIEAVLAQRLVRRLCPSCRMVDTPDVIVLKTIGFPTHDDPIYKAGAGCEACRGTGYAGRTGIYELLLMDEHVRQLVTRKHSSSEIRREAINRGMQTLRDDGWRKVLQGATSIEEILRVAQQEE